jgi:hypothetical protein
MSSKKEKKTFKKFKKIYSPTNIHKNNENNENNRNNENNKNKDKSKENNKNIIEKQDTQIKPKLNKHKINVPKNINNYFKVNVKPLEYNPYIKQLNRLHVFVSLSQGMPIVQQNYKRLQIFQNLSQGKSY